MFRIKEMESPVVLDKPPEYHGKGDEVRVLKTFNFSRTFIYLVVISFITSWKYPTYIYFFSLLNEQRWGNFNLFCDLTIFICLFS